MKKLNIIYLSHSPHQTHYKGFFNSLAKISDHINLWVVYSISEGDNTNYEEVYSNLYKGKINFKQENLIRNAKVYSVIDEVKGDEFTMVVDADDKVNTKALENIIKLNYLESKEDIIKFNTSKRFNPFKERFRFINPSIIAVDSMIFKTEIIKKSKKLYEDCIERFGLKDKNRFYKPLHMSELYFNLFILNVANSALFLSLSPYEYKEHSKEFINLNKIERDYRKRKASIKNDFYMGSNLNFIKKHLNLLEYLSDQFFKKDIWKNYGFEKIIIQNEIKRLSINAGINNNNKIYKRENKPSIVICSNFKNDYNGAVALIKSIKMYTDISNIYILTTTDTYEETDKFLWLTNKLEINMKIIYIDDDLKIINETLEKSGDLDMSSDITAMAFARLLIPSVLGKNEELIYMDTDTLFVSDFSYRKTKIKRMLKPISVIKNNNTSLNSSICFQEIYGNKAECFDPGIIFFNKRSTAKNNEIRKAFKEILQNDRFQFSGQTHINFTLKNNVSYLKLKYNTSHFDMDNKRNKLTTKPIILHFNSSDKPWDKNVKNETKWIKKWKKIFES